MVIEFPVVELLFWLDIDVEPVDAGLDEMVVGDFGVEFIIVVKVGVIGVVIDPFELWVCVLGSSVEIPTRLDIGIIVSEVFVLLLFEAV